MEEFAVENLATYNTFEELWEILSHPGWTLNEDTSHPARYGFCICKPQIDFPVSLTLRLVIPDDRFPKDDRRWYFVWEFMWNLLSLSGRVPREIKTVEEAIEYAKQESARSYQDWCRKVESQWNE